MKRSLLFLGILSLTSGTQVSAADLSWGDPTLDSGQFKVSGAIRSRYLHKDYVVGANEGSQNDDWRLTDIKLVLGYENPNWIAGADARCYQYDHLCDAIFLKKAWVGYKLSDQQRVTVGLQPVDFGFGEFWGSSYYETLLNTVGLEDIDNLGIKYKFADDKYNLTLGFYPTDGGNYKGTAKD
ncbi:phosphate-selective porin O and P family protein [Acinetobacter baumannii 1064293_45]|nr:phosphate-selective porin O and P family protein [Acinetobacter baumannii 1064293_45]